MKLVMTMMVRDEADIVGAAIAHHFAQGVDQMVITDNGSVDGTTEILADPRWADRIDLRHDPVHKKQQYTVVTAMARDAYTMHGADWVLNADADEFWLAADRSLTLKQAFEGIPTSIGAFTVPVIDMIGPAAWQGSGLGRLTYRDNRSVDELHDLGIFAHSTPNAVHVGRPDVEVAQGNHFVNIESDGEPDAAHAIEVLHFPWRSWTQFERKVAASGRAYESNPTLAPSPNHHGMKEYARFKRGVLFDFYVARHPTEAELRHGVEHGVYEPERALASAENPVPDQALGLSDDVTGVLRSSIPKQLRVEEAERQARAKSLADAAELEQLRRQIQEERDAAAAARAAADAEHTQQVAELLTTIDEYRRRKLVRAVDTGTHAAQVAVQRATHHGLRAAPAPAPTDEQVADARVQAVRDLLARPLTPRFVRGRGVASEHALPVLLTVPADIESLRGLLDMLIEQTLERPLRVVLWSNDPAAVERAHTVVDAPPQLGAVASVELYASTADVGAMGLFLAARRLWDAGTRGPAVLLGSRQRGDSRAVAQLLDSWSPRSISATWAFASNGSFWRREEIAAGELADIAGVDGTIIDLDLVADPTFFDVPGRYLPLAAQWMTHWAHTHEVPLLKAAAMLGEVGADGAPLSAGSTDGGGRGSAALGDEFARYLSEQETASMAAVRAATESATP